MAEAPDPSRGSARGSSSVPMSVPRSRRAERCEPSPLGLSVDSCLSAAGELCISQQEEEDLSAMSDSLYSTASDVTLVAECRCPSGVPCRCGAARGSSSSSTDSGTSVRGSANGNGKQNNGTSSSGERRAREALGHLRLRGDDRLPEVHVSVDNGVRLRVTRNKKPGGPEVTVSTGSVPARTEGDGAEVVTPQGGDDSRPEPSAPSGGGGGGGAGLRVPEPERARRLSLDSSGILAAAFHQSEQFHELNDVRSADDPVSFAISGPGARETRSASASASASRSNSASASRSASASGGEICDEESRSENELEAALYQFHHQRREDLGSSSSDVSVQELELETTGDFPHDFQFPEAGGSSRGLAPARPQLDRTLSGPPGRGEEAAGSVAGHPPVPVVVVAPAEEEGDAAASAAAPPAVQPAPRGRRGLLARLVDSTAAFLLGGMQDDGGDRRHRSYTVSASDYRRSAAAAAAKAAAAAVAARRAAADGGADRPAAARSPLLGQVEEPAPCRSCREPSCPPEVPCQPPLARRRSIHSDERPPVIQDTSQIGGFLAPPGATAGGGGGTVSSGQPPAEDLSDERRKLRQQAMQNELRVNVTLHNVQPGETIPSIAAFYECLPGELKELNRLQFRRTILPGQVLRVLDRRPAPEEPQTQVPGGGDADQAPSDGDGGGACLRHRSRSCPDQANCKQHIHVKRARLFTESEGVATGTLMVTPNTLMFRPNVSDPLVVDRGVEYYTVDIPVRYLVTAEYYTEPPHHSPALTSQHREAHRESFSAAERRRSAPCDIGAPEEGAAVPPPPGPDGAQVDTSPPRSKRPISPGSDVGEGPAGAAAAPGDSEPSPPQQARTDAGPGADGGAGGTGEAKRPAYGRRSNGGRLSFSAPPPPQEGDECGSPLSSEIPIVSTASSTSDLSERSFPISASLRSQALDIASSPVPGGIVPEDEVPDKLENAGAQRIKKTRFRKGSTSSLHSFKNETPVDEKPWLFKAADELLRVHTPVVSQPPLYLEVITGKKRGRLLPRSERTNVMFCGQRRLPSRVLFAVPRDNCDDLYQFIKRWAPTLADDVDLAAKLERQDFEPIDSDDDIWEPEELEADWETIELGHVQGLAPARGARAGDAPDGPAVPVPPSPLETVFLPELVGNTTLLTDEARLCLQRHLPGRVEGHPWQLVFSTGEHGFSLKTLYRQAVEFDCPMLLVIEDSFKHVFGAVCTDPIRFGKHYYGTGESFLFTLRPEFRAFRWSGENQYFARGSTDCLEFGSGDGRSGLFLDEGLVRGYTQPCQTYNNDPLTITKDFGINAVELWALG